MKRQLGNFIVMFRPGVVTGQHSEREVILRDICDRLGGFDCKVFDPYMTYTRFADTGRPKLISHGYVIVSDCYGNLSLKLNSSSGVRKVDKGAGY